MAFHIRDVALAIVVGADVLSQLRTAQRSSKLAVFVSHSSYDTPLAEAVVPVLCKSLKLRPEQIRCTSVSGSKLPHGSRVEDTLYNDAVEARTFLALITPNSIASPYVMCELGARFSTRKHFGPLLAGGGPELLHAPWNSYSALHCDMRADVQQMLRDLGCLLGIVPAEPSAYEVELENLIRESKKVTRKWPSQEFDVLPAGGGNNALEAAAQ